MILRKEFVPKLDTFATNALISRVAASEGSQRRKALRHHRNEDSQNQKLIFKICPLFPTNHPASGFANPTAQ
jgi:hypothetical protein